MTTVAQKTFDHNGALLAYCRQRRGNSTTVVIMIHGLASNSSRWSEFIEHCGLEPDWDLLAVDLRGHGASITRCRQSHAIWIDDIHALLKHEGYDEAVVIGHSLGAQTAIHFAQRYPQLTKGLVLIEPLLPTALRAGVVRVEGTKLLLRLLIPLVRLANRLGVYRRYIPQRDLYELDRHMRALMLANPQTDIAQHYARPFADLKYVSTTCYLQDWFELLRPLPPLDTLALPVLVLLSKGEQLSDQNKLMQHLTVLPEFNLKVFDANHWLLTEMPQASREAIEAWCAEQNYQQAPSTWSQRQLPM